MRLNASWVGGAEAFIVTVATRLGKSTWAVSTKGKPATARSTLRPQFSMHSKPATRKRTTLLLLLLLLLLVLVEEPCGGEEGEASASGCAAGRGMVDDDALLAGKTRHRPAALRVSCTCVIVCGDCGRGTMSAVRWFGWAHY